MTALPNKCYIGHHNATEKEDDQETRGKEIWRGRCGKRASGLAGGRWRRQHKIELDGDEWSVTCAPLGATRHKSSHYSCRLPPVDYILGSMSCLEKFGNHCINHVILYLELSKFRKKLCMNAIQTFVLLPLFNY